MEKNKKISSPLKDKKKNAFSLWAKKKKNTFSLWAKKKKNAFSLWTKKNKKYIKNTIIWISILTILASIAFLTLTFIKSTGFTLSDKWITSSGDSILGGGSTTKGSGPLQRHFMQLLIAFFGGGALGLAGALLQKVTKNRLAEVSILGIGSLIYYLSISMPQP